MLKTRVYIDGFNLYYGALRASPYRWLNLFEMARLTLPKNDVQCVTLFTAMVGPLPHDPDAPNRQKAYFRALSSLPPESFQIVLGHFLAKTARMPLAEPPAAGSPMVRVIRTEEKGSDVNLAVHLVDDAAQNRFEAAVVFSADSDLYEAVRLAKEAYGKTVGVVIPQTLENYRHKTRRRRCAELRRVASFTKDFIPDAALTGSLFPEVVKLPSGGTISRPAGWETAKPKSGLLPVAPAAPA